MNWRCGLDAGCNDRGDSDRCGSLDLRRWSRRRFRRNFRDRYGLSCGSRARRRRGRLHRWRRGRFFDNRRGSSGVGDFDGGLGPSLRAGLLGGSLLGGLGLFRLVLAGETVSLGAATHPIGLLLNDGGGMALGTDAHRVGQFHDLCVGHPELFGELVHPHVLRQDQYSLSWCCAEPTDRPASS